MRPLKRHPSRLFLSVLPQKVYCVGDRVSTVTIEGGTFRDNTARESGGVIAFGGASTLVTITGGAFLNNNAT